MKPANLRTTSVRPLLVCLVLYGAIAACPASTPPPVVDHSPSPHEQALIDVLSAQSYAATIANLAGTARGKDEITEDAYRAITAAGMALDVAWREATQALVAGTGDLQQRLNVMAEKRRNLEAVWQLNKPPTATDGGVDQ